jgi:hypothetical protein
MILKKSVPVIFELPCVMMQKKDKKRSEYMDWIVKRRNICVRLAKWEGKKKIM